MNWIELKERIDKLQDEENPNRLNCVTHAPNCQQDRKRVVSWWVADGVVPLLLWSDLTSIHYCTNSWLWILLHNFLRRQPFCIQSLKFTIYCIFNNKINLFLFLIWALTRWQMNLLFLKSLSTRFISDLLN
jgi:hypothetical protein